MQWCRVYTVSKALSKKNSILEERKPLNESSAIKIKKVNIGPNKTKNALNGEMEVAEE